MSDVASASEKPYALSVVQDTHALVQQKAVLQDVVEKYLVATIDFGLIPGTGNKPALFKAGAEKLMDVYGLAADPVIESKIEDYDRGLFDYTIKAYIKTRDGRLTLSSALGSCSSFESKYRYITRSRACPECNAETILKSKFPDKKTGDLGFYCYAAKGGCGVNFTSDDKRITEQEVGKKQRDDMADIKNTILKMAEKRAVVAAVIRATRSAELFTQDLEDMSDHLPEDFITVEAKEVKDPKQKDSSTTAKPAGNAAPTQKEQGAKPAADEKKPAKPAEKPKESKPLTETAPAASGESQSSSKEGQQAAPGPVSGEEFKALKGGVWEAAKSVGYDIEGFKAVALKEFDVNCDVPADIRAKLDSSLAGQMVDWFTNNPKVES
jgi:hypothetical protein